MRLRPPRQYDDCDRYQKKGTQISIPKAPEWDLVDQAERKIVDGVAVAFLIHALDDGCLDPIPAAACIWRQFCEKALQHPLVKDHAHKALLPNRPYDDNSEDVEEQRSESTKQGIRNG